MEHYSPRNIVINDEKFKIVPTFCYLGDVIGQSAGYISAVTARIYSAWMTFQLRHDRTLYYIETSLLISSANQWTGVYMIGTSVIKELIVANINKSRYVWSIEKIFLPPVFEVCSCIKVRRGLCQKRIFTV